MGPAVGCRPDSEQGAAAAVVDPQQPRSRDAPPFRGTSASPPAPLPAAAPAARDSRGAETRPRAHGGAGIPNQGGASAADESSFGDDGFSAAAPPAPAAAFAVPPAAPAAPAARANASSGANAGTAGTGSRPRPSGRGRGNPRRGSGAAAPGRGGPGPRSGTPATLAPPVTPAAPAAGVRGGAGNSNTARATLQHKGQPSPWTAPPRPTPDLADFSLVLNPEHPMWPFLRALPAETLARAPALISEKHLRRPCYGQILDRPFALASFRMSAGDPEACNDACRLVMVLPALILGRHSAGPEQARPGAAWIDVVEARIRRLLNGEFQELFEAIASGAPAGREEDRGVDPRVGKVKRALQRARQGSVSKAVGALRGGGILPLEQERVRLAFAGLLVPHAGDDPLPFAQAARLVDGSPSPDSDLFNFTPTVSMVPGPNGELIEVPTLDWSMQHLDPTSAPGISGLSNMILKRLSPALLARSGAPFLARVSGITPLRRTVSRTSCSSL